MTIRSETSEDRKQVYSVHAAAFDRLDEADLVERLRPEGVVLLSLVAELETRVVGHVLFSRMAIVSEGGRIPAVALAPVGVLPPFQRQGVGSGLIREGLDVLRQRGERIVIVLGEPDYYHRFGFSADKARSLGSPFPPEAFMALELVSGALDGIRGRVRYSAAFGLTE